MKAKWLVLLFGIAAINMGFSGTKSGENNNTADPSNQASVADGKKMIIAKLTLKPEKVKEFITAAREMIEKSNKESGCTFYQLYQDPYDNSKFVFIEEYKNQAAVDAHFSTEYFKAFGPKIAGLVAAPTEIKIISVAEEVVK
jgi:quinol monooxygenase YgiN